MSWKPEVDEIAERKRLAKAMGGEESVARQHSYGKRTIRERIDALLDAGSFKEHGPQAGFGERDEDGKLTGFVPGNYVLGVGTIGGRRCVVGGEDFTLRGGSPSPAGLRKSVWSEELAVRYRLPLLRFLEGGGGSVAGSSGGSGKPAAPRPAGDPVYSPQRFAVIANALQAVPVVSGAMGAVAGFPAARLVASHLSLMTRETSQVLIGGPALVERALGEKKTKAELGGPDVHLRNGVVDNLAEDEEDLFEQMKRFLAYLPSSAWELPPERQPAGGDRRDRCEEELLDIVPRDRRRLYDMRRVLELVLDRGSFFEKGALYGRSQIVGLARLDGVPVGVWANDPKHNGGAMGADGAQKVRRFLELCETFHLPVVCFVDEPGFMIGSASEQAGTIRYGMEAIAANVRTTVPWASVQVRKSYGVAAAAHYGPNAHVLAWPSAESGALPLEGGVAVAFRREIAAAPDPEKRRRELEEELSKGRTPFPRAEWFSVHDLIDPRETRPELCAWLDLCRPLLRTRV